jgi:hypothetical protein
MPEVVADTRYGSLLGLAEIYLRHYSASLFKGAQRRRGPEGREMDVTGLLKSLPTVQV